MSNRVTIQATGFKNVPQGTLSLGVRIWDDYEQAYDDTWESIPENDLDVLQKCLDSEDEIFSRIIDSILESQKGVYINGTWYEWEEIKHLFETL